MKNHTEQLIKNNCGYTVTAKTGEHLIKLLEEDNNAPIIIVSRDKFENAMRNRTAKERLKNINQEDLFILFDETN
jgi:hypothetical protein